MLFTGVISIGRYLVVPTLDPTGYKYVDADAVFLERLPVPTLLTNPLVLIIADTELLFTYKVFTSVDTSLSVKSNTLLTFASSSKFLTPKPLAVKL